MKQENEIFLVAQKSAQKDEPTEQDIYEIGTLGVIIQLLRLPDGTVKALVEGKKRATARKYIPNPEHFVVEIEEVPETGSEGAGSAQAVGRVLVEAFKNYAKLSRKIQPELVDTIAAIDNPAKLSDVIASHLGVKLEKKQALLEITDAGERLREALLLDHRRDRDPRAGRENQAPCQEADGEDPEGLLPQRADACHPEGDGR